MKLLPISHPLLDVLMVKYVQLVQELNQLSTVPQVSIVYLRQLKPQCIVTCAKPDSSAKKVLATQLETETPVLKVTSVHQVQVRSICQPVLKMIILHGQQILLQDVLMVQEAMVKIPRLRSNNVVLMKDLNFLNLILMSELVIQQLTLQVVDY